MRDYEYDKYLEKYPQIAQAILGFKPVDQKIVESIIKTAFDLGVDITDLQYSELLGEDEDDI